MWCCKNRPFKEPAERKGRSEGMTPELLARAVEENELRDELFDQLSPEEASAFDDYVSEYHAREYVINKKDS